MIEQLGNEPRLGAARKEVVTHDQHALMIFDYWCRRHSIIPSQAPEAHIRRASPSTRLRRKIFFVWLGRPRSIRSDSPLVYLGGRHVAHPTKRSKVRHPLPRQAP